MPMLEVFYSGEQPPTRAQCRTFAAEASAIFQRVIGTPPGRLQLVIQFLPPMQTLAVLDDDSPDTDHPSDQHPPG
ncbi:tautomerase family protein [Chloroflexus sp.]|uniref:tautomerase family protein n=1 Tax=Chloroflexus sp. TaxID=1904827 RepID=UPI002639CA94|nr:hypothetical protein [uncultured Chloroflexus sp.]